MLLHGDRVAPLRIRSMSSQETQETHQESKRRSPPRASQGAGRNVRSASPSGAQQWLVGFRAAVQQQSEGVNGALAAASLLRDSLESQSRGAAAAAYAAADASHAHKTLAELVQPMVSRARGDVAAIPGVPSSAQPVTDPSVPVHNREGASDDRDLHKVTFRTDVHAHIVKVPKDFEKEIVKWIQLSDEVKRRRRTLTV